MARNRIRIDTAPEHVFAVLSDPNRYPDWVVGASDIREFDESFPAAGSRFHHEVGLSPFTLNDHTEVLEVEPPRRIVLRAKARPLGTALIEIELSDGNGASGGTEVLMDERPADRLTALVARNRVADSILRVRNAEALTRLKRVAEGGPVGRPARRRKISGQRVLITGGSSGIGLATAEILAAEGARVALLARNEEGLAAARGRVAEAGPEPVAVSADVRDRDALDAAIASAVSDLGGLDVLISSAASLSFGPFTQTPPEDFDATVGTVLGGTANAIRSAMPHLERSSGAVVVVGSTASRLALPGLAAYTAAKHALAGLLWALRVELADAGSPVSVSLVNPGGVDTPLWGKLQSSTGLLPPPPPDLYSPRSVAQAIVGVVRHPRPESVVGASARAQLAAATHLGAVGLRLLAILSRMAEAAGDRPAQDGALYEGRGAGRVDGGYGGRDSVTVRVRGALDRARRAVGVA